MAPPESALAPRAGAPVSAPRLSTRSILPQIEYRNVRNDLRRIAVLAAGMLVVMIALTFVIR